MPIFNICKEDPIVRLIRKNYKAVPIKNPSQRYQPLTTFTWSGGNAALIGDLKNILIDGETFEQEVAPFDTKSLEHQKSRRVNTALGLDLLGTFLKPLGLDTVSFGSKLETVKQVSFSLEEVSGRAIDRGALGKQLQDFKVDIDNLMLSGLKSGKGKLMVIDSVLASKRFSFKVEKTTDVDFNFETPDILNELIDPDAKTVVDASRQNELQFETESPLSFAFTCIELQVDWATGQFTGIGANATGVRTLEAVEDDEPEETHDVGQAVLEVSDGEMIIFDS